MEDDDAESKKVQIGFDHQGENAALGDVDPNEVAFVK